MPPRGLVSASHRGVSPTPRRRIVSLLGVVGMEIRFVVTGEIVLVAGIVVRVVLGELGTFGSFCFLGPGIVVRVVLGELGALGSIFFPYTVLLGWLRPVATAIVLLSVIVIRVQVVWSDSAWHPWDEVMIKSSRRNEANRSGSESKVFDVSKLKCCFLAVARSKLHMICTLRDKQEFRVLYPH